MRVTTIIVAVIVGTASPLFAGDLNAKPAPMPVAVAPQKIPGTDDYFSVIGESQDQCRKQYGGDPDRVYQNSDGTQTWQYAYGRGKLFIPFGLIWARIIVLKIDFDSGGMVTKWSSTRQRRF